MYRVTLLLLLVSAHVIVLNSDARAIELKCNQSQGIAGRAQAVGQSADKAGCDAVCTSRSYNNSARPVEAVTCEAYKYKCVPVIKDTTLTGISAQFTPATIAPGPSQEQPGQQPLGDCSCSASLDLKVECVPEWDAPRQPSLPVLQESQPITCCTYHIPAVVRRPGFWDRLSGVALTVGAYTRDGIQVAAGCSDGSQTFFPFDFSSDMDAERYRIEWLHYHGFTGWIERDGFKPIDGVTGYGIGYCWTF